MGSKAKIAVFCFFLFSGLVLYTNRVSSLEMGKWSVLGFFENNTVVRDTDGFQYGFMDNLEFIQVRNTFKLETNLGIRKSFHLLDSLDFNVERMFASFRAAYDAIYDLRTFPIDNEFRTGKFELGEYDLKWEHDLREIYLDVSAWRLWARLGRQIVSWGETDGFRILDIVNPLDTSYNLFFIMPEENRIPLYMARLIMTLPDLKRLTNTDLEFLWIPDKRPTLQAPLGAPYSIPLPFNLPTIAGITPKLRTHEDVSPATFKDAEYGVRLTSLFDRLNFSLAYFHGIQQNPGARLSSVDILFSAGTTLTSRDWNQLSMEEILQAIARFGTDFEVLVNLDMVHPFVDVAGFSYNFFEDHTGITLRGEFTYTWDMAVIDLTAKDLMRKVDRIDWAVGFDRNTWIHFLNKSATFLFSLQVIGRHYQKPIPNEGNLLSFPVTLNLIRRDSYMVTLTARTTYHHGFIIPTLFIAYDVDGFLIQNFMFQWIVNNHLSFILSENAAFGNRVKDIERDPFLKDSQISLRTVIQF